MIEQSNEARNAVSTHGSKLPNAAITPTDVTPRKPTTFNHPPADSHDSPASDAINNSPSIPFNFNEKFIMIALEIRETESTKR